MLVILIVSFDLLRQCPILHAKECNLLSWLAVLPIESDQFDLSAQEFHNGLALSYRKPLICLPSNYNGCGAPFTVMQGACC